MLNNIMSLLIFLPVLILLWSLVFLSLKTVFDEYGIHLTDIFNRKVVDIPDFVNIHRNSEIEYLFKERGKNDNEIQI